LYIIEIDIKPNNDKVDKSGETFGLYTLTDRQVAVINRFDVGSSAGYFSLEPGTRSDPYGGYSGAESYIGTNDHPFTSMYSYTTNGNYGNSVVNVNYLNSNNYKKIYVATINKTSTNENFCTLNIAYANYILLAVYEKGSSAVGAPISLANNRGTYFVYSYYADGTPYKGALTFEAIYCDR
jgi:hypothetical protein